MEKNTVCISTEDFLLFEKLKKGVEVDSALVYTVSRFANASQVFKDYYIASSDKIVTKLAKSNSEITYEYKSLQQEHLKQGLELSSKITKLEKELSVSKSELLAKDVVSESITLKRIKAASLWQIIKFKYFTKQ